MRQTPPNAVAIAEPNQMDLLFGLIGAMVDDLLTCFEHKGLKVRRKGDSIEVMDAMTGDSLGGRMLVNENVEATANWIEAKAEHY